MTQPALMGIVNVTPDSFSDGGRMGLDAVLHAEKLVRDGADILDIGAESTRPGAKLLSLSEEWARLQPVLTALYRSAWAKHVRISIDTRKPLIAARALDLGAQMINDVGSLSDPEMLELMGNHACDIVVMHALSVPADPEQTFSENEDPVTAILQWKRAVTLRAANHGIVAERLIFDPGIGFGKTASQSLELIDRAGELVASGGRWLYGHSRKSCLRLIDDVPAWERDEITAVFSAKLAQANVTYLRVHDVAGHHFMFDRLCA